jgi:hypothetical protein
MLVATRAVLLPLDALGVRALVLRGEVIPVFALVTREDDFLSRHALDPLVVVGGWFLVLGFPYHPSPITQHLFFFQSSRPGLNR